MTGDSTPGAVTGGWHGGLPWTPLLAAYHGFTTWLRRELHDLTTTTRARAETTPSLPPPPPPPPPSSSTTTTTTAAAPVSTSRPSTPHVPPRPSAGSHSSNHSSSVPTGHVFGSTSTWQPSPSDQEVLRAGNPRRRILHCRSVGEHPEVLEVVARALAIGAGPHGHLRDWNFSADVSVRDEVTGGGGGGTARRRAAMGSR